jgi:cellulose synthase/poly-beta-1,6-N-acetylglucosamine synthase-like glycosyltransferase
MITALTGRGHLHWPSPVAESRLIILRLGVVNGSGLVAKPWKFESRHVAASHEEYELKPKVVVVLPAYNASRTLRMTYEELPKDHVHLVILVDDGSTDNTIQIARELNLEVFVHNRNYGYGANQKTCYAEALKAGSGDRRAGSRG